MKVAVISNGRCVNTAVFADLEAAQAFLRGGVWPEADSVAELPEGFGIGDSYTGEVWEKPEQPKSAEPEASPSPSVLLADLDAMTVDQEYRIILLELGVL